MHRLTLTASALLLLTACQQPQDGTTAGAAAVAPVIEPTLTRVAVSDCTSSATPTVVRYHSRLDLRTQHSVHLLNPDATAMRVAGCDATTPVASVVTLRYRVAGS